MKMKKQTKKQALANSWLEPHITTPQNSNDYNVKGGNAAPAGNRPTHRVWWDNLSDSSKAFLCREHYCHEQHETLKESEIDNIFRKEHNRPAAPPPAGNDLPQQQKTFYEVRHSDRAGYYFIDRHEPEESFTEVVLDGSEDAATKVCTIVEERAALQEQNKELLEALKEIVSEYEAFSDVPANLKSFPGYTGENTREQAMVRALNLISKYSK